MKKTRILACLLAIVMIFALSACGGRGTEASGESSGSAAIVQKDIVNDPIKIAFAVANMDTNTSVWLAGVESICNATPNVTLQVFTANGSAETQSTQLQEIINQEFDAIIIHPVDSAAAASLVADAEAAGIVVIHLNLGIEAVHSGGLEANSYNLGVLVANDAYTRTGGNAKCVAIGPPVELSSVVLGVNGFEDTLAGMDGMEFLESQAGDWTTERANAIMRDLLTKYNNDIDVVFAHNDQMAIGAAQAIEAAGLTGKILVYGADGSTDAMQYIADGKMTGTVYFDNYQMGQSAVQFALYALAAGVNGSNLSSTPVISVPMVIISSDNLADYQK